jgi:AcrR family transcriptional regulator
MQMENLISQLQIRVNEHCFLKDPNSSRLGKNIVSQSIVMIDEIGFESFTFRKLAQRLNSTESSIYRYFESKFKLLIYLTTWYWSFMEYRLVFSTSNIQSPEDRLRRSLRILAGDEGGLDQIGMIDLKKINRIVVSESSKAYLNRAVDEANKAGLYAGYKQVVARLCSTVLEINPEFRYSRSLISTVLEGIHHQKYFADHLPSLTDIRENSEELAEFFYGMILSMIQKKPEV